MDLSGFSHVNDLTNARHQIHAGAGSTDDLLSDSRKHGV